MFHINYEQGVGRPENKLLLEFTVLQFWVECSEMCYYCLLHCQLCWKWCEPSPRTKTKAYIQRFKIQ